MIGNMRIYPDTEALSRAAAEQWISLADAAVATRGKFHVALSGGSTPKRLYEYLAMPEYAARIPWQHVHVYFGDERAVPPDHADSNYRMACAALLNHVPVPPEQIFRIQGEDKDPGNAATQYSRMLSSQLSMTAQGVVRFDLVLLGVGADGHVASLFPGTPILRERARLVEAVHVEKFDSWRISITFPVIDAARHIMILVAGANKAEIMRTVFTNRRTPPYPVQLIHPSGTLEWYIDEASASLLPSELRS